MSKGIELNEQYKSKGLQYHVYLNTNNINNADNENSSDIDNMYPSLEIDNKDFLNLPFNNPIIPLSEIVNEKENKNLGRKTISSGDIGEHNKYSSDNVTAKIKGRTINYISDLINDKIKAINQNNDDKSKYNYLLKISEKEYKNNSVEFNRKFLKKNLKTIFSVKISKKYKIYDPDNNIKLIQRLLTDKNEEIKEYFEKLFKLTFLDCLKHFRGSEISPLLDGMTNYKEFREEFLNDKEYQKNLDHYVNNYEALQEKRKARPRKKKENEINKFL